MKKITILDVIITILFIFLITGILSYQFNSKAENNSNLYVETDKAKYYYSMDQEKVIDIQGYQGITKIQISNGKFAFIESACPNKDCIKTGWVSIPNFPVICLPNKVSAYIVNGRDRNEFDGVSR